MLVTREDGMVVGTDARTTNATRLSFALRCHPGSVRAENQDRVLHAATPLGELFIVADGVGGHADGAIAAQTAVDTYAGALRSATPEAGVEATLHHATEMVNHQIALLSERAAGEYTGGQAAAMASTVVLAVVQDDSLTIGHLGDSRAYLFRRGELGALTRDHSVVQRMVDAGILDQEQALTHPSASVLTRCLGQADARLDVQTAELQAGDLLLLCSDGLWAYLSREAIGAILEDAEADLAAKADQLLAAVLATGAPDNVGILMVQL